MSEKIYLHGISTYIEGDRATAVEYDSRQSMILLNKILKCGALLSLRNQRKFNKYNFAGPHYISLCDYDKRFLGHFEDPTYNSYNSYIRHYLSLMFNAVDVKAVIPEIVNISNKDKAGFMRMERLGRNKEHRYSDMVDEVQVKDILSLESMIGITFPTWILTQRCISTDESISKIYDEISKIKDALNRFEYDVPIYDIDSFSPLNDKSSIEMIVQRRKQLTKS